MKASKVSRMALLIVLWIIFIKVTPINAQEYGQSAGLRLGDNGITYKNFVVEEQAFEMILTNRKIGLQFSLIYLNHLAMDLSFSEHFYFYYGGGGHVGYEERADIHRKNPDFYEYEQNNYITMGIDGMAGLEYRMLGIPMTLSMDLVPYVNYAGFRKLEFDFWNVSVGAKYIF